MNSITKLKNIFGKLNLQRRLMAYFILVCIIPLLIFGSISIYLSVRTSKKSTIEFSDTVLSQIQNQIEGINKVAINIGNELAGDNTVQTTLRKPVSNNLVDQYKTDLEMETFLIHETSFQDELFGVYVLGENNGEYKSIHNSFYNEDFTEKDWYQTVINSRNVTWFSPHLESYAVYTPQEMYITVGIPIKDKMSSNNLGIVLVDIEFEKIMGILTDSFGDNGNVLIIDENKNLIGSSYEPTDADNEFINTQFDQAAFVDGKQVISTERDKIIISHELNNGWTLMGIIPTEFLIKDSYISVAILLTLLVIISILTLLISKLITSTITVPLNNIIDLMKDVEAGNFNVSAEVFYDDEIGKLSENFNEMTSHVNQLMNQSIEKERKLRHYEFQALQSQINPHFLYNTLDSVVWLARVKKHDEIITMITAMTNLFKISLSKGKDIITVGDEIQHITSYLMIQKIRYKTKFDYSIDVPENIKRYQTLKLILQPLIENAIYHGVKLKKHKGYISIVGFEMQDNLIFKVSDSGPGMTKETIDEINYSFKTGKNPSIPMYGIKNVNERIQIFFGNAYGLSYESNYGEGTVATIKIPKWLET